MFSGELLALTDDCVLQMLMLEKGSQVRSVFSVILNEHIRVLVPIRAPVGERVVGYHKFCRSAHAVSCGNFDEFCTSKLANVIMV